jgi:outer membrane protein
MRMRKSFGSKSRKGSRLAVAGLLALSAVRGGLATQTQGAPASPPAAAVPASQPSPPAATAPPSSATPAPAGQGPGVSSSPTGQAPGASSPPAGQAPGGSNKTTTVAVDVRSVHPGDELALPARGNAIELSLDQAVEIALRRNLALILQRYVRNESRLGILQALGIYDVNAPGIPVQGATGIDATYQDSKSPAASQVQASSQKTLFYDVGVSQLLPYGTAVNFTFDTTRQINNNPFSTFKGLPFYVPHGLFNVSQPLLRGFGRAVVEQPILIAVNASQASRAEFERQVIAVSVQVINAYWALVNAREQLVVAQESLQLATDLNARNKIQVQVGTLAPLEVTQSEAAIATRELAIIAAQAAIGDAADQLRLLLNVPQGELWQREIVPTTPPETAPISVNLADAIETALASRTEVREEVLLLDRSKINQTVARNNLLPRLDLTGGYTYTGLASDYGTALHQVTGLDFPTWNIGLHFGIPLQNRAARAANAIASLEVDRVAAELDQQKKLVINEVRRAARAVDTAAKQIEAAHASRNFQEKNLDAERKRYENGMSTSFQITQIQDQLTQQKSAEVNAVVGYRTALAEYYRTIGKLLPQQGIQVIDPQDEVHRFSFRRVSLP